jgi:hypothetical protein
MRTPRRADELAAASAFQAVSVAQAFSGDLQSAAVKVAPDHPYKKP